MHPLTSLQAELWDLADGLSSLGTHRAIMGGLVPVGTRALAACRSPPVRLQASSLPSPAFTGVSFLEIT